MSDFIKVNLKLGGELIASKYKLQLRLYICPRTKDIYAFVMGDDEITHEEYDRLCKELGVE